MMCFEVVLPIIVALFAVFGVYSLLALIGETWFGSDNIAVSVEVDTSEVASNLEGYLREARRRPLSHSGGVTVLIRREHATQALTRMLRRRHIRYYIVDMENEAE